MKFPPFDGPSFPCPEAEVNPWAMQPEKQSTAAAIGNRLFLVGPKHDPGKITDFYDKIMC
jgi:hypothetical protein